MKRKLVTLGSHLSRSWSGSPTISVLAKRRFALFLPYDRFGLPIFVEASKVALGLYEGPSKELGNTKLQASDLLIVEPAEYIDSHRSRRYGDV